MTEPLPPGRGAGSSPRMHAVVVRAVLALLALSASAHAGPAEVDRAAIEAAVAASWRSPENRARDGDRHPVETLAFFGVHPEMHVVELLPGKGWYTEILAPLLRERGTLVVATPGADNPSDHLAQMHADLLADFAARPALFDRVAHTVLAAPRHLDLGPPGSADCVLTFRSVHNWLRGGTAEQVFAAIARVLAPGGILGVEQHRAPEGSTLPPSSGYVTEAEVRRLAEGAGLEWVARSEINANPRDDHDHPEGVWSLPPTLRGSAEDRARHVAIGESDRMTLLFRKP